MEFLWVGIGGFFGAIARFLISLWARQKLGETFPWGTTLVNISGSLALGLLISTWGQSFGKEVGLLVGAGFMGAYTTFSTFGLETLNLIDEGEWIQAGKFVLVNVLPGLGAAWLGFMVGN